MLVLEERGKPEYPEKNVSEQGENQQQTQPKHDAGTGNQTRATLVGGECSHHCSTPAPQVKSSQVFLKFSRDGAVVRALASHQCGRGLIPGPDTISGLSLCWFSSLLRGFFSGFSGFPPSAKTSIQPIPAGCKLCSKVTHGPYSRCQRRHCLLSVRPC